jgi:predicted DNA-binding transcriptional regulator YafY
MHPSNLESRWQRVERLLGLMASRDVHSVASLAQQLDVSARTVARDLKLLVAQGYEIESSSGPGGGVSLSSNSLLRPLPLRMEEAIELLLALALCEQAGLALLGQASFLRTKLARLFATKERARINALRKRIRVTTPASSTLQSSPIKANAQLNKTVCEAFFQQQLLNVNYKSGTGVERQRIIEAQYLLVSAPFFYLIAWDQGRQDIRTFRSDRFVSAHALSDRFRLRAAAPFWGACLEIGVGV